MVFGNPRVRVIGDLAEDLNLSMGRIYKLVNECVSL